jgi:hypothetical protein
MELGLDDACDGEPPASGPRRRDAVAPRLPVPRPPRARPRWLRLVLTAGPIAGVLLATTLLAPATAERDHLLHRQDRAGAAPPAPAVAIAAGAIVPAHIERDSVSPMSGTAPAPPRAAPAARPEDDSARERLDQEQALALVQRGREAFEAGDFAGALVPLAEHARRFARGPLASHREKLWKAACAELRRRATPESQGALARCGDTR